MKKIYITPCCEQFSTRTASIMATSAQTGGKLYDGTEIVGSNLPTTVPGGTTDQDDDGLDDEEATAKGFNAWTAWEDE